ncbi:MAG TPA: PAS domain S-box protein, partial [Pirellulaceae bacterium]|nr:PAS domain S-box protein [Pirellulaceae bacterium]
QRRDLLRTTLASIGDAVITTDVQGQATFLNPVAESLTGWLQAEAYGRPLEALFQIVHDRTRESVENPAWRALREGAVIGPAKDALLVAKDGAERLIESSASPIRNERGELAGCVLVFRDVTERRRSEQALERKERELTDFFDNANVGLHWVGPDGTILRANQAELDLFGYRREEYVGHKITEFHLDRPVIDGMLVRLLRGETLHDFAARLRCKDGSIKYVLINSTALIEDGKLIHTRSVTRDITSRKRAAEARALLAAIVETSDDAIISKSLDGVILSWNAGAERLFGYTAAEAIGQSITFIIPPERQQEEPMILERLRAGRRIEQFETVRVAKEGRRIDVALTISPVLDRLGRVVAASKVARDITARKRAEEALRESEERFARFMQHLPGLAWIKDAEGRYVYVNHSAEKAFQKPAAELYGKTDEEVFPPATAAAFRENDRRALATKTGMQTTETLEHEDGLVRHSIVSKFPILDADGSVVLVGGMAIDVTERIRAENALRESEARFRLLADAAPVMIWISGIDKLCTWFNRPWLDFVGRPLEQELGDGWMAHVHPLDLQRCLQCYAAAFEAREPFSLEYRLRRHDGHYRWVLDTGIPLRDAAGEFTGFIGSCLDITDRKQAEVTLRESEARKTAMVQAAIDCIITMNHHGRIVEFNPAAERTFGYSREQALGREMVELLIPKALRERHRRGLARFLATGEGPILDQRIEMPALRADGTEFPAELSVTRIAAEGPPVFTAFLRDISERKRAEESLKESEQRLRLALDAGRMGTWEWDIASNSVAWSPGLEAIHGLAAGSFPGTFEAYQQDIHPEDKEQVLGSIQRTLQEGKDYHIEYRIVWPDGSLRWVEGRGRLVRDDQGQPLRMVGVCTDITSRKHAGDALKAKEAELELVAKTTPVMLTRCSRDLRFLFVNHATAALFGGA